jgi:ubiquinone/menaquinone biosynthesis C-methylase UbiE
MSTPDATSHWNLAYQGRGATGVSWHREHLEVSLELLERAGLNPDSAVIDIGGGASTLVDDLIARGLNDISVLDLSGHALSVAKSRLGDAGQRVHWLVADLLDMPFPAARYDFWHDRAVLHFLTEPDACARYSAQAAHCLRSGGHAVIAGFAADGPERCSGLAVARRSPAEIARIMNTEFMLIDQRHEQHHTPMGTVQSFAYALLRRR